jgi:hypothetical protein
MGATLRPFNALNGQEVKKRILTEIERQLDADYRFRGNVAYPVIAWRWKMVATVYPGEPANWEVNVGPVIVQAPPTADKDRPPMPNEVDPKVEVEFSGGSDVGAGTAVGGVTADALRRDTGLPVPTPRKVAGPAESRMTVDAPVLPTSVVVETAKPEQRSEANIEKGGRVFARSVTAKTAAAPAGVEVAPAAGASPTHSAEDIQKILEQEAAQAPQT